eukprot:766696-Hanusia_phi.AAC.8
METGDSSVTHVGSAMLTVWDMNSCACYPCCESHVCDQWLLLRRLKQVAEEPNDSTVVQGNTFEQQQDTNLDHEEVVAQGSFPDRHAHNHRAASPVSSRPPDGFASKSRLSAAQQAAADERAMKLRKQEELKESLRLQVTSSTAGILPPSADVLSRSWRGRGSRRRRSSDRRWKMSVVS